MKLTKDKVLFESIDRLTNEYNTLEILKTDSSDEMILRATAVVDGEVSKKIVFSFNPISLLQVLMDCSVMGGMPNIDRYYKVKNLDGNDRYELQLSIIRYNPETPLGIIFFIREKDEYGNNTEIVFPISCVIKFLDPNDPLYLGRDKGNVILDSYDHEDGSNLVESLSGKTIHAVVGDLRYLGSENKIGFSSIIYLRMLEKWLYRYVGGIVE